MSTPAVKRRLAAEAIGTGLLVMAVIGSGIMASRLSPDDVGLQLLENAVATAGALVGLILMPAVTVARSLSDSFAGIAPSSVPMFVVMQVVGALFGFAVIRFVFADSGDPA